MVKTRAAKPADLNAILKICEMAFEDQESTAIMELAAALMTEKTAPPILSLVATLDDEIIGYVSFSPIYLESRDDIKGYILAPLAVAPGHQRKGAGTTLIREGKQLLADNGVDVVLVYGDPDYYSRTGFTTASARLFVPPYPLEHQFGWQGLMLRCHETADAPLRFRCVKALCKPALW